MPSEAASSGREDDEGATSATRRRSHVARPGHTATLRSRGGTLAVGSEASTRAKAAPSHPRLRLCTRLSTARTQTHARTPMTPPRVQSTRGDTGTERSRHTISEAMTRNETRGAPRRKAAPGDVALPRRSTPGHARVHGRERTSKVSAPTRSLLPGASRFFRCRRRHRPRRVHTWIGEAPVAVRRCALPARVENVACSRAMLEHAKGTCPARPTVPGAMTSPTSGPSTHARWRSVRRAVRARQAESFISPRSRCIHASSSASAPTVDRAECDETPVDNRFALPTDVDNATRGGGCARAAPEGATQCKNGPHG